MNSMKSVQKNSMLNDFDAGKADGGERSLKGCAACWAHNDTYI